MTDSVKISVDALGASNPSAAGSDFATATLQQREAMIDRVCQAILTKSGSLRAGSRG